jgi:hypothetical protein
VGAASVDEIARHGAAARNRSIIALATAQGRARSADSGTHHDPDD